MEALGQVADDQAPALHNLDASAEQLDELLRPARPVRRRLAAGLPRRWASASKTGDRAVKAAPPVDRPARRLRAGHARARQEPRDRPRAPRRPQARRREGPAQPRRPGLHRPRGAAAVRLRPDDVDVDLRPEQPHPQDRRLRRAVRRLRRAQETLKKDPSLEQRVRLAASGPIQPGLNYPDVDPARDARRGQASAAPRKRADGDHDLPLPAVPAPRRHARAVGARDAAPTPARRRRRADALDADGPDADRPRRAADRPAAAARHRRRQRPRRLAAAAAAAQAQREDEQRPAGPDQAPRLPPGPMKRGRRIQRLDRRQPRARRAR